MGGLSSLLGGSSKSKSSQSASIPGWLKADAKPLYTQSAQIGQQIANQQYQKYTGARVADVNKGMQSGINGLSSAPDSAAYSRAQALAGGNGSEQYGMARKLTGDTLSGKYLQGNPYLDDVVNKSTRDITSKFQSTTMPQMQANLARQGAFGGSAWAQSNRDMNSDFNQQLTDAVTGLRYQDYNTERGYQNQAIGDAVNQEMNQVNLGLSAQQQQENAYQNAIGANDIYRQRDQAQIDADYGDYTEQRDWLFRALQGLGGGIDNIEGLYGKNATSSGGGNVLSGGLQLIGGAGKAYNSWNPT